MVYLYTRYPHALLLAAMTPLFCACACAETAEVLPVLKTDTCTSDGICGGPTMAPPIKPAESYYENGAKALGESKIDSDGSKIIAEEPLPSGYTVAVPDFGPADAPCGFARQCHCPPRDVLVLKDAPGFACVYLIGDVAVVCQTNGDFQVLRPTRVLHLKISDLILRPGTPDKKSGVCGFGSKPSCSPSRACPRSRPVPYVLEKPPVSEGG